MDLTPHVERVRRELVAAADAAGDDSRALAERLAAPLDSVIRLSLLSALSMAADEITRELAPGSVDLRLRGLDPTFVVTAPPADLWTDEPHGAITAPVAADDEGTARINFRPPESLKSRIEAAAARDGLSVNAWLVRALNGVLDGAAPRGKRSSSGGQSYTGWVR